MYLAYLVGSGINPVQLGADAVGNTMRLDNCLHNLPQSVTDLESKLMQLQNSWRTPRSSLRSPSHRRTSWLKRASALPFWRRF